ncbi:MAG: endonuclease/exonuclease/phosphatase family metal-dependent hydrolase [Candidatus Azotimanducaceae bacterium]|jgi:endonuclease/exonuclease/phosphatase family metal-dependent hydrolase
MPKKSIIYFLVTLGLIVALIIVASIRQPVDASVGADFANTPINNAADNSATLNSHKDLTTSTSFRVANYNIARGKGKDGIRDIHRASSILAGFDIIGLNEVGGFPLTNHAEKIGEDLKMAWLFAPNQRRWFYDYFGNAMLSNLHVTEWRSEMLPRDVKKNRAFRNYILTHFNWQGEEIVVITTHLGRGDLVAVQLDHVMQEFVKHPHAILMGDFNLRPSNPIWEGQKKPELYTEANTKFSADGKIMPHHGERVDYIFVRGLKIIGSGHYPRGISDHPMIWAEVTLEPI